MSINTRISVGVAFLSKALSATSSAKYIIHAEYLIGSKQYLLTKVKYYHNLNLTLNVKTSETYCANITDILQRLAKVVAHKTEDGYAFDSTAMEIMGEEDETWGDFELAAATTVDPLLDVEETPQEIIQTVARMYGLQNRPVRNSAVASPRNRKTGPLIANSIRRVLNHQKASQQKARMR